MKRKTSRKPKPITYDWVEMLLEPDLFCEKCKRYEAICEKDRANCRTPEKPYWLAESPSKLFEDAARALEEHEKNGDEEELGRKADDPIISKILHG